MANQQSLVSISAANDELCNWELINQSDYDDDDETSSVYDIEFIDLLDSLSSSSDQEQEEHTEMNNRDEDSDVTMGSSPPIRRFEEVSYARVVQLGQNLGVSSDNFSSFGANLVHSSCRGDYYYDDGLRNLRDYHNDNHDDDDHHDEENDDDGDDDGGYGVDDELVPWEVKDRVGRQRMRKLGKRAFAKMTKSKKSAYIYTRPGCVRGKHGLGLKAY